MSEVTVTIPVNGKTAKMSLADAREMFRQLKQLFDEPAECNKDKRKLPFPYPMPAPSRPWVAPNPFETPGMPLTWCGLQAESVTRLAAGAMSAINVTRPRPT